MVLHTKKKIIAGLVAGAVVIAGAAIAVKIQDTPPDAPAAAPSSPAVQREEHDTTPAESPADLNAITADAAQEPTEDPETGGQGEGADPQEEPEASAGGETELPTGEEDPEELIWGLTEASVLYRSPQPGDKYVREDGSIGVIADWDEADRICLELLTPEELQELRDLNLTFN